MACPDAKMNRSVLSGDLSEVLADLQGSVYFQKKLSPTNALRRSFSGRRFGQLSLPRWFVLEHGNKLRRAVELRSDLTFNKPWHFWLSFCTSRGVPEVIFSGKQWGGFVTCQDLVLGDWLVFSLTAMSRFQVYAFNGQGDFKGPQTIHSPMKFPEAIERPLLQLTYGNCVENKVSESATCIRKKVKIEDDEFLPGCAPIDAALQISPVDEHPSQLDFLLEDVTCRPSFSRKMVAMNEYRLEIPRDFLAGHRSQVREHVQLQGIREESPAQDNIQSICYVAKGVERVYLKGAGWETFVSANELCCGQELVFTLTAASCFSVREQISWSPDTGLNLSSPGRLLRPRSPSTSSGGAGSLSTSSGCSGSQE